MKKTKYNFEIEDIFKELNDEFEKLTHELQNILPNVSVSTSLFEAVMNVHVDDEVVCSGDIIRLSGCLRGMIVAYQMK